MTRKLNAQFLAIMAAQAATKPATTVSLEAEAPADPTETHAPNTDEHDKAAEEHANAAGATDAAAAAPADAAAPAATDAAPAATDAAPAATDTPADAAATDPAAAIEDPIAADLTAAGTADPVTGATDADAATPGETTDPVADTVAAADAGTPPADATTADAGQGSEPQKIVIDVNVNVNGGADADAPAASPVDDAAAAVVEPTDGVVAEEPVVSPDAQVNPEDAAATAPVVLTEPVNTDGTPKGSDAVIDETSSTDTTMVDANILSEEELKIIEAEGDGSSEVVKAIDGTEVDIDVLEGEIGAYEKGHVKLNEMTEVLDTASAESGLDGSGAKILKIAIEHIVETLQIDRDATLGMPSMESFDNPSKSLRVSATTLAMEDLKETAQAVWKAIQAGWAKIMEWLGNFFKHVFDANARMATRAQQIQQSVKSVGDQVLNQSFDNPNIARKLASGQKVSSNVAQQLVALNKFAAGCSRAAPALLQECAPLVQACEKAVTDVNANSDAIGQALGQMVAVANKFMQALTSDGGIKEGARDAQMFGLQAGAENQTLYTSNTWLGNKIVYGYLPNDGGQGIKFGQATADVGEISPAVPVLAPKDINNIAGLVLEYTKEASGQQAVWTRAQELYKTVMAAGQIANSTAAMQQKEGGAKWKMLVAALKDARAICTGMAQPAFAIAAGANMAALDYAAISLKTLGAKAAGEVAAAKAKAPAAPAAAAPAAPAAAAAA